MARTYRSPLRQAQAAQTRASIVDAARELFDKHGYAATTLDMIAGQSSTSPNTVYAIFRTKTAILHAILQAVNPEQVSAEAVAAASEEGEPRRQLRKLVERYVALNSAADGVFSIASGAALTDPDAAKWWETAQNSEWHEFHALATKWNTAGGLLESLSAEDATNSLWAMTRPSLIRSFVHDCGWTVDRCVEWLTGALEHALFEPRSFAPADLVGMIGAPDRPEKRPSTRARKDARQGAATR